jgi:hypothetical protein
MTMFFYGIYPNFSFVFLLVKREQGAQIFCERPIEFIGKKGIS